MEPAQHGVTYGAGRLLVWCPHDESRLESSLRLQKVRAMRGIRQLAFGVMVLTDLPANSCSSNTIVRSSSVFCRRSRPVCARSSASVAAGTSS